MAAPHRTNTAKAAAKKSTGALGLADLLANRKAPSLLLADIRAHVVDTARTGNEDRSAALHPSDISRRDWCPRANLARLRGGVAPQRTTFTREVVFAHGHQAHERWQRWMAQMALLEGRWICQYCGARFYANAPKWCDCGSEDLKYDELVLEDPDRMIEGRTDGYIPSRNALVEIKTVGEGTIRFADPKLLERHQFETPGGIVTDLKGAWNDIHRPFTSHLRQGQLYLYLARRKGLKADRMVYIYESKLTQDAKEFVVSFDQSLIEPILVSAREVALAYHGLFPDPACRFPGACKDCEALA